MTSTTGTSTTGPAQASYADLRRLMSLMTGDAKHDQAATSTLDVLWVLYDRVLRVTPQTATDDARDRFVLSKGHGPAAYYAVLAAKGFLDPDDLPGFGAFSSALGFHPDHTLVPGIEISSGSLGHGLPLAVGMALGLRALASLGQGSLAPGSLTPGSLAPGSLTPGSLAPGSLTPQPAPRVFVLVGDGELDEGSNHEAIAFAARAGLDSLTVVVVDNASATHGWPGGVQARFAVEGWSVLQVSGRDHDALEAALTAPHPGRPHMVAATVEAKWR
jgi:transketolase